MGYDAIRIIGKNLRDTPTYDGHNKINKDDFLTCLRDSDLFLPKAANEQLVQYYDKDIDGFVYFKGRLKRMIITSGYCVYPTNIENVIDSHPDVKMSCVIGIPHPYKVTVAKAFIVLRHGVKETPELLVSIKELVEQNLARFSWPYEYEFRSELPKTLVGKIAYNVLIHEEEMKNGKKKFDKSEELLEQVEDESSSEALIDNSK